MEQHGHVAAVCVSSDPGVPKYPQSSALMGLYGLSGDYHAGEFRISRATKLPKLNDRQVSLVALEVLASVGEELMVGLQPGYFGENITTQGLGDLSDIKPGTIIRIGQWTYLQVTEQNEPCVNLNRWHPLTVKKSYGRRGLLAVVKSGEGAVIRPGDVIVVQ